jgi:hypothetical protein
VPLPRCWAGVALLPLLLAGCSSAGGEDRAPEPLRAAAKVTAPLGAVSGFTSVREVGRSPVPARLRIRSLQVDAAVGPVGKQPDGSVEVPIRREVVGWFDQGPRPGEDGPAVLLGHVDSRSGPAVFARLARVGVGAVVEVVGTGGEVTRFRVERVQQYSKLRFPTDAVYLPVLRSGLRLVTCGGEFDQTTRHFQDNVVVYASLIS